MTSPIKYVKNTKPTEIITSLIDLLRTPAAAKQAPARKQFILNKKKKNTCFMLLRGSCVLKRPEDAMIMFRAYAPAIIGLNVTAEYNPEHYIQAMTDIEYEILDVDMAIEKIREHNFWEHLSYLLMYYIATGYSHVRQVTGASSYDLICCYLYDLENESADVKNNTTACDYITSRCSLSRSHVMKVLSALKTKGHIATCKGVLVSLKSLPEQPVG